MTTYQNDLWTISQLCVTRVEVETTDLVDLEKAKLTGVSEDETKEYTEEEIKNIGVEGLEEDKDYKKSVEIEKGKTKEDDKWVVKIKPKKGKSKGKKTIWLKKKKTDPADCKHDISWTFVDNGDGLTHDRICDQCYKTLDEKLPHVYFYDPSESGGTIETCGYCSHRRELANIPYDPKYKAHFDEIMWDMEDNFPVIFELFKGISIENIIGSLLVLDDEGEIIGEAELKLKSEGGESTVTEGEESITVEDPGKVEWLGGKKPGDDEEVTVVIETKKPAIGDEGEKWVISDEVRVKKGQKKTQTEIQAECTHDTAYGRSYIKNSNGRHNILCGKCNKFLEEDDHTLVQGPAQDKPGYIHEECTKCDYERDFACDHGYIHKYQMVDDRTHDWICTGCNQAFNNAPMEHRYVTEPHMGEDGKPDGYFIERCADNCGYEVEMSCNHPEESRKYTVSETQAGMHDVTCEKCGLSLPAETCTLVYTAGKDHHHISCSKSCGLNYDEGHELGERLFTGIQKEWWMWGRYYWLTYYQRCKKCEAVINGRIQATNRGIAGWFFNYEEVLRQVVLNDERAEKWRDGGVRSVIGQVASHALVLIPLGGYASGSFELILNKFGLTMGMFDIDSEALDHSMGEYEAYDKDGKPLREVNHDNGTQTDSLKLDADTGEQTDDAGSKEFSESTHCVVLTGDLSEERYCAINPDVLKALSDGEHVLTSTIYVVDPDDPSAEPVGVATSYVFTKSTETIEGKEETVISGFRPLGTLTDEESHVIIMSLSEETLTYTGSPLTPPAAVLTVSGDEAAGVELVEGTDYTLSYYRYAGSTVNPEDPYTPVDKDKITEAGGYRVVATGIGDRFVGTAEAFFTVEKRLDAAIEELTLTRGGRAEAKVTFGQPGAIYTLSSIAPADESEEKRAEKAGIRIGRYLGTDEGSEGVIMVAAGEDATIGTTRLRVRIEASAVQSDIDGAKPEAVSCETTLTVTVRREEKSVIDENPWNLFEDGSSHVYYVDGLSASKEIPNSNKGSEKYYSATLTKDVITVSLKSGADRKKAAAANTFDFDLGEEGAVSYVLPLTYNKPVFRLSSTKGTVKKGTTTALATTVLYQTENGDYAPYDLTDATVTGENLSVTKGEDGRLSITASGKASGKLTITKEGWNDKDPVALKYTVAEVASSKDVLAVDLGGLKQVVLNTNAPEQSFTFPLTFNGAPATAETVTIDEKKKGAALGSIGEGALTVSIGRSGVGKGSYTLKLTAGKAALSVKVKVSDKALNSAVTGKVTQKYDVVTKKPMVVTPTLKEVNGTIRSVSVSDVKPKSGASYRAADFDASVNDAGAIEVNYVGEAEIQAKNLKIGDMTFALTVADADGNTVATSFTVKNVAAKKTNPTAKTVKVTIPKAAAEAADGTSVIGTANIVSTFKDSAKHVQTLAPVDVELTNKNVEAVRDSGDTSRILITKLTGGSGTIKAKLTYPGGVTKTVTIKVTKGNK